MIAAGALLMLAGLWLLLFLRRDRRKQRIHLMGADPKPRLSEPTRLAFAFITLIWGYHMIMWAMPAHWSGVQLSRDRWYIWFLIGILSVGLSLLIDNLEKKSSSPGDSST